MKVLLIFVTTLLLYCSSPNNSNEKYNYNWPLTADSMNLAILIVNPNTYTLEAGHFATYELYSNDTIHHLPFDINIINGHNFDDISVTYSQTGDTLFRILFFLTLSEPEIITCPHSFLPADTFKTTTNVVSMPDSVDYYGYFNYMDDDSLKIQSGKIWSVIENLDIVNDFGRKDFLTGFYVLPPDMWVIFLYQ